ncbi:hypothetical protein LCGC14_1862310 [marine sediment metagenome]|uniref:Uncharacterized protein n=1 Tax=marine sediment metagenome TaxID=412755 RepID=A0A0F9G7I4_9ZZZZ
MRNEIERKHNENWRRVFKEFVKAVESKHQENKDSRNYSYFILFKIGHRIWNETTK